jgi:hypothetical protein
VKNRDGGEGSVWALRVVSVRRTDTDSLGAYSRREGDYTQYVLSEFDSYYGVESRYASQSREDVHERCDRPCTVLCMYGVVMSCQMYLHNSIFPVVMSCQMYLHTLYLQSLCHARCTSTLYISRGYVVPPHSVLPLAHPNASHDSGVEGFGASERVQLRLIFGRHPRAFVRRTHVLYIPSIHHGDRHTDVICMPRGRCFSQDGRDSRKE